jgi:hypothetical protein
MMFDISLEKSTFYALHTKSCGVACRNCGWVGLRIAKFKMNLNSNVDTAWVTNTIKGRPHNLACPRCLGDIVWTHYPTPTNKKINTKRKKRRSKNENKTTTKTPRGRH